MWLTVGSSITNRLPAQSGGSRLRQLLHGFHAGSPSVRSNDALLPSLSTRRSTSYTTPMACIGFRRAAGLSILRFVSSGISSSRHSRRYTNPSSLAGHRPRGMSGAASSEASLISLSSRSSSLRPHSIPSIWNGYLKAPRPVPSSNSGSLETSSSLHSPHYTSPKGCSGSSKASSPSGAYRTPFRACGSLTLRLSSSLRSTRSSSRSKRRTFFSLAGCRVPSRAISPARLFRPAPTLSRRQPTLASAGRAQPILAAGLYMRRATSASQSPSSTASGSLSLNSKRLANPYPTPHRLARQSTWHQSARPFRPDCPPRSLPSPLFSSRSSQCPTMRMMTSCY